MVLPIESYQSRREAARLEVVIALPTSVSASPQSLTGFPPAIRFEAIVISIWVAGITALAADP
jgi:hypothetical protein